MGNTVQVTSQTWEKEVLKSSDAVMVDFWAAWCGPCKMIAPTIEELAAEYAGKVKIGKVDVDHNPQTASRYSIRSIPSLLLFKNGNVLEQLVGVKPKAEIKKALERSIA